MSKKKYDAKNFIISKTEAQELRALYLMGPMREYIRRFLNSFPQVQSVELRVAQYYNDEASDAVHFRMYPSVLPRWVDTKAPPSFTDRKGRVHTPKKPDAHSEVGESGVLECLKENLPFVKWGPWSEHNTTGTIHSLRDLIRNWSEEKFGWGGAVRNGAWEPNGACISLFAAYCDGEGDHRDPAPLCLYTRAVQKHLTTADLDCIQMTMVAEDQLRPELDGIRPLNFEGEIDNEITAEEFFKYFKESIERCSQLSLDPLAEMREQIKRQDLFSREDERRFTSHFLLWSPKGPGIVGEDKAEKLASCNSALIALKEEWERREAFDAEFARTYGKNSDAPV